MIAVYGKNDRGRGKAAGGKANLKHETLTKSRSVDEPSRSFSTFHHVGRVVAFASYSIQRRLPQKPQQTNDKNLPTPLPALQNAKFFFLAWPILTHHKHTTL